MLPPGGPQDISSPVRERRFRPRALEAFQRYRQFRYLWASNLSYFTGIWMQTLVLGWVTYEVTHSAFLLALFTAARLLPMALGPVGGLLADRVDRLRLLAWSQVFVLGVTIALAYLVSTNRIAFWELAVGGFLVGLTQNPIQPTRNTLIMDIVQREEVSNAIALNTIALSFTRVIGPALGGALLAYLGSGNTLWLSALWYLAGIIALIPMQSVARQAAAVTGTSPLRDLWEGFRIVLGHPQMRAVISVSLSANIFVWPIYQAFMPVFADDILKVGAGGLGALLTASGIGAVLGAIFVASLGDFKWKGQLYIWGTAAYGLFCTLFALSHWFPASLVLMVGVGLGTSAFSVMQATLLLILAPPEVRGRALGVQVLAIGILPLATLLQGAVASVIGVAATTALAGALLVLNMVLVFVWAPGLRRLQ